MKPITEYVQQDPHEGAPVSERTESWVLYDDRNIYFVCRCLDEHPERMVANEMRRDSTNLRQNDNFAVELDTFHDKRNGFLFYITPVGGMWDSLTTDERSNNGDWNTVWEAKARRTANGWIAEIAIPFKSLRYKPGRDQVWGINLRRGIRYKNEYAYISPIKPQWGVGGIFHVSAAATLVGLEAPPSGKNLEVKPAIINRLTTDRVVVPAATNQLNADIAVDAKYGLTKSLTADLTYNTDFAQVEADEVQVNLTRFCSAVPRETRFLPRGTGHISVRCCRLRRQSTGGRIEPQRRVGGRANHLLQPADRAVEQLRHPDPRRRTPVRTGRHVEHRRLEHREQGRRHGQRPIDRFHRAPRAPRRPASQHGRRDGREPIGVGGCIRLQHARGNRR